MTRSYIRYAVACFAMAAAACAQAPSVATRSQVSGTVTNVGSSAPQLSLKSDQGADVSVTLTDRTVILRIPPGETDSRKGTKIAISDIAAGDRAVIVGPAPADPKNWTANAIMVMSRSDVASLQQKEQEDWKKRGTLGIVTAVDPAGAITIRGGHHTFTVKPSANT